MQKTLTIVGNSLALVIDKPTLRALGITRGSKVRLTVEGRTLRVESAEEPAFKRKTDPRSVFETLWEDYAMQDADFAQLHHAGMTTRRYFGWLAVWECRGEATPDQQATFERLKVCLDAKLAGSTWEDAIATATTRVPIDGTIASR